MFEVSIRTHFSGAHHLRGYQGSCSNLHGHNWEVEVFIRGRKLNRQGILVDFRWLKEKMKEILAGLDHKDLNRQTAFARTNPTSENIARYLFRQLAGPVRKTGCSVHRVQVRETPDSTATYWGAP